MIIFIHRLGTIVIARVNKTSEVLKLKYYSNRKIIMVQTLSLNDVLQQFVSGTPNIQGAALVTSDGLPLSSILPASMDEERTAAMSAAMLSLGERIGKELSRGVIERIFVEGEKGYSVMVGCGEEIVLLVLADRQAKQGLLFLEIKRVASKLSSMVA